MWRIKYKINNKTTRRNKTTVNSVQKATPDSTKASLLTLPAEIWNKIYAILFEVHEPIRVFFTSIYYDSISRNDTKLSLDADVSLELCLFSTCRALREEAGTSFYKNNIFHLVPSGHETMTCFIDAFKNFLDAIGSQASWLRTVIFDLGDPCCGWLFCHDLNAGRYCFPPDSNVLDVTNILEAIWYRNLEINVSFTRDDQDRQQTCPCGACEPRVITYDAPAMTKILPLLQSDQLQLRKFPTLIARIGIKYDGTGGMILWKTTRDTIRRGDYRLHPYRVFHPPLVMSTFSVENSGASLKILKETARNLLDLPKNLQNLILRYTVIPEEGLSIDLDVDTRLPYALTCINEAIYTRWREAFLTQNDIVVKISTTEVRSDFNKFLKLRSLLRKKFDYEHTGSVLGIWCGFRAILDFKLESRATLKDICVSILPLIMETSASLGDNHIVCIRLWQRDVDSQMSIVDEHDIPLRQLRREAVQALLKVCRSKHRSAAPEIWINGLGNVVEVRERARPRPSDLPNSMPEMASEVVYERGRYKVINLHDKDKILGFGDWEIGRTDCVFDNCDQFFPYNHSAWETLYHLSEKIVLEARTNYENDQYYQEAITPFVELFGECPAQKLLKCASICRCEYKRQKRREKNKKLRRLLSKLRISRTDEL